MSVTKDQILEQARALSSEEQEQLADALWLLAQGATKQEIEEAWAMEIRRRVQEAERGEGYSRPAEEIVERLRAKASR